MTGYTEPEKALIARKTGVAQDVLTALLHMSHAGDTWEAVAKICKVSKYRILSSLEASYTIPFDEEIRWLKTERDCEVPWITGFMDHTTTIIQLKSPEAQKVYYSAHKGMTYKYLVACTAQGTPLFCSPAQPGRRHDMFLFRVPLVSHRANDFFFADGGYRGCNDHVIMPIRKPVHRDHDEQARRINATLSRVRSRIERLFGHIKRFKIISSTHLSPATHQLFTRFLFLCEHIVLANRHAAGLSPYHHAVEGLQPSLQCTCSWRQLEENAREA